MTSVFRDPCLAYHLLLEQLNNLPKLIRYFARVGWRNIGSAAAEPAGPAPMALHNWTLAELDCGLNFGL